MMRNRVLVGAATVLFAVAFFPPGVKAHHNWGKYHWARSANPLALQIADNVDGNWGNYLSAAIADWDVSTVLSLSVVNGSADPVTCPPTAGREEICNASYGDNGWLGVTQIWTTSGSHITQATTKLNDYYFNTPEYNTAAWRRMVMCHEVGHVFGLDHPDERFTNANLGTCLDYTDDPDGTIKGQLSNLSPNAHDFQQLASIYSHLDGTSGGGGGGGGRGRQGGAGANLPQQAAARAIGNDQRSWGQLISSNGRLARYVLDLGNGDLVFTFVILAR